MQPNPAQLLQSAGGQVAHEIFITIGMISKLFVNDVV